MTAPAGRLRKNKFHLRKDRKTSGAKSLVLRSSGKAEHCALSTQEKENKMNFLNQLLRGIAFIPALVSGIEGLFGGKSGAEKKDAAMSFLESALATVDAVAAREIINPEKFKDGISKIIDGTVECLNASTWAKAGTQQSAVSPQP
jgi:hypothetical protein